MPRRSFATQIISLCLTFALCTLGIVGALRDAREMRLGWISRSWPVTPGTITKSELITYRKGGNLPKLSYDYLVGSQIYSGSRYEFNGGTRYTVGRAKEIFDQYQPGPSVTVSYDASHPEIAVLKPGLCFEATFHFGISLLLAVFFGGLGTWSALGTFGIIGKNAHRQPAPPKRKIPRENRYAR